MSERSFDIGNGDCPFDIENGKCLKWDGNLAVWIVQDCGEEFVVMAHYERITLTSITIARPSDGCSLTLPPRAAKQENDRTISFAPGIAELREHTEDRMEKGRKMGDHETPEYWQERQRVLYSRLRDHKPTGNTGADCHLLETWQLEQKTIDSGFANALKMLDRKHAARL